MIRANLFAVNIDEIRRLLAEANAALAARCEALAASAARMPENLSAADDIARAIRLRDLLRHQLKECREARLADERPFKEAVKVIDEFFAARQQPIKAAQNRVLARLGDAERRSDVEREAAAVLVAQSVEVLAAGAAAVQGIDMEWTVKSIDVAGLDLEALRPFISSSCAQQAATKFLKANGPREVAGVSYERRAKA